MRNWLKLWSVVKEQDVLVNMDHVISIQKSSIAKHSILNFQGGRTPPLEVGHPLQYIQQLINESRRPF